MEENNSLVKDLKDLFVSFLRIGALTFGGGYAMMPILQREVVEKKHIADMDEIMDWYAMGQCLPGIIMVNTAVFTGNKKRGCLGGAVAAIAAALPSLIIITVIAAVLSNFADIPAVRNAFAGIRVCVCVLVLNAVVTLWKKAVVDKKCLAIFLIVALLSLFFSVSPILLVLVSAAAGLVIKLMEVRGHAS